jgi:hypothetical protein
MEPVVEKNATQRNGTSLSMEPQRDSGSGYIRWIIITVKPGI